MKPENLEAVYRLSPTQEGILFHALATPGGDRYFLQTACALRGSLDVPAFQRAWEEVVARHPALRTAFQWEGLDRPVQVVSRAVPLPWRTEDWRGVPAAGQERRWQELRRAEQERGLELSEAPLLRFSLVRFADDLHRFLWSYHHIVVDGWCLPILFREVFALYSARLAGRPAKLAPSRPYADYIAWLKRQDPARAEAYWQETLGDFTVPTPLPGDLPPGSAPQGAGDCSAFLPAGPTAALTALARRRQLTMSTLVQGAWGLLLSQLSGESDVVFGVVFSGRSAPLPGIESMIGLFINTLPVRLRVRGEMPAADWLQSLQEERSRQLQYESTPLVQAHGWSGVPRGVPLFESIVAFENYPVEPAAGETAVAVEILQGISEAPYPLSLMVFEGARLSVRLGYDRSRFDEATAERVLEHFLRLLASLAADSATPLRRLALMGEAEQGQVLAWSRGPGTPVVAATLDALFAAQAAGSPDAVAVAAGDEAWTYRELDRRARRIAHRLRRLGVGPESRVAVCLERSPQALAAILGVLKAGGAYVPLEPDLPDERLRWIVAAVDAAALVTLDALGARIDPEASRPRVLLDVEEREPAAGSEADPVSGAGPDNAAYVLFTSGSTGSPKGVVVPHRAVVNMVEHTRRLCGDGCRGRVAQMSALSFDGSVLEIFATFFCGGQLSLLPREVVLSGERLSQELARQEITQAFTVPAVLALLAPGEYPALRTLVVGGDRSPAESGEKWSGARPFFNFYGPTEMTVYTTVFAGARKGVRTLPIGRPISNAEAYLLDGEGRPVAIGAAGEVHLAGAGMARGYLGRADLTAERFVPHPFAPRAGERLYRTGDLARWLPEGELEFLGRADDQVKLRGVRIEPAEVEAALERHPQVRQAAVSLRRQGSAEPLLTAYLTIEGDPPAKHDLRSFLGAILPAAMIPAAFVVLAEMPLTRTGKIDRRALPDPGSMETGGTSTYVEPRDETERQLAAIWSEVLGVERVGVYDNFFELGGHSLLITRVRSRVQAAFEVDLPLADLFSEPVFAAMAMAIRQARPASGMKLTPIPRQRHSLQRSELKVRR